MKVTNIEHIHISDQYRIDADDGAYTLTVTMLPHKETEPTMKVVREDGVFIDSAKEEEVINLFLNASKPEQNVAP